VAAVAVDGDRRGWIEDGVDPHRVVAGPRVDDETAEAAVPTDLYVAAAHQVADALQREFSGADDIHSNRVAAGVAVGDELAPHKVGGHRRESSGLQLFEPQLPPQRSARSARRGAKPAR